MWTAGTHITRYTVSCPMKPQRECDSIDLKKVCWPSPNFCFCYIYPLSMILRRLPFRHYFLFLPCLQPTFSFESQVTSPTHNVTFSDEDEPLFLEKLMLLGSMKILEHVRQ
jgi:hypothetical protein